MGGATRTHPPPQRTMDRPAKDHGRRDIKRNGVTTKRMRPTEYAGR